MRTTYPVIENFIAGILKESHAMTFMAGRGYILLIGHRLFGYPLLFNVSASLALHRDSLPRSPPTKASRVQSPAGSPDSRKWESCRMMPSVGGFSRGFPVSPAPSFRRCSIFTSITLIGSQDLAFKRRPNLFTSHQAQQTVNRPHSVVNTRKPQIGRTVKAAQFDTEICAPNFIVLKALLWSYTPSTKAIPTACSSGRLDEGSAYTAGKGRSFRAQERATLHTSVSGQAKHFMDTRDHSFGDPLTKGKQRRCRSVGCSNILDIRLRGRVTGRPVANLDVDLILAKQRRESATSRTSVYNKVRVTKANGTGALCGERLRIEHHKLEIYVGSASGCFWGPRWLSGQPARLPPRQSGLNPRPGHSGFSHVGIVPDDAVGRWVLSGISRPPRPAIPALPHPNHPRRLPRPLC
ncbi:hypothetical protein PR048_002595 [Dryococelus australis]|uniref:Uncharacterized protein n=1 Tax=Dryococelus australis TaxID=614101 RepID=A0ABQ9IM27_9NEOP|nr:hypothetical protein PR048_002595 [Dryococelus australis]